ncbi:hypothetical protein ASPBRDRAFT_49268 [Aspergillus brasiliensis CBS 101740]|uniref:Uncharacterized protein n=1 Tax=Aspergillus brasiliensis (strain CBS 101740 / IMI 381727 / IBT 21946) TaxID=767769 RepID=A0A1L9U3E2_ASPBC|nr:hypothetical protein ASPBRDRAFT_49268 [Aspergillus brasiliensis CBS 101740]
MHVSDAPRPSFGVSQVSGDGDHAASGQVNPVHPSRAGSADRMDKRRSNSSEEIDSLALSLETRERSLS